MHFMPQVGIINDTDIVRQWINNIDTRQTFSDIIVMRT